MRGLLLLGVMLVPGALLAQGVPATSYPDVQTTFGTIQQPFTHNIQEEDVVAPVKPAYVTPSAVVGAVTATASATLPVSSVGPFTIKGVVVTLSSTAGFARDSAMDKAAAMGLPKALEALPMPADQAVSAAKAVGDPLKFVSSYKIVKEALIPTYSLTVDLTFNEPMLRANFGGVAKVGGVSETGVVSGTAAVAIPAAKMNRFIVHLNATDPISQDRVYHKLGSLVQTTASYRIVAGAGVEMNVTTPLDEAQLNVALSGTGAVVASAPALPVQPVSATTLDAGVAAGGREDPGMAGPTPVKNAEAMVSATLNPGGE